MTTEKRYSWTQPSCEVCWDARNPGRTAHVLKVPEPEICVYCGQPTDAGIYVRIDPAEAPHPTLMKE